MEHSSCCPQRWPQLLLVEKAPSSHLFGNSHQGSHSAEGTLKGLSSQQPPSMPGSSSQSHLRSTESLWLVEVNKPGVAQRSPAQGMHIKADNAYKCK